ncbi:hypothetical protein BT69DRAFT_1350883 [Atractiella rhizophila]|nr:hypothetical protein BT69DRAFT_1350883 [Atractiella rhizophila]
MCSDLPECSSQDRGPPLLNLPPELVVHILSLISPRDILRFSATSRKSQPLAESEDLWRRLVKKLYKRYRRREDERCLQLEMFGEGASWFKIGKWMFQHSAYLGWWASNKSDTGRLVKCSIVVPPPATVEDGKRTFLHPPLILAEQVKPVDLLSAKPHLFNPPEGTMGARRTTIYHPSHNISAGKTKEVLQPQDPSHLHNSSYSDQWQDFIDSGGSPASMGELEGGGRTDEMDAYFPPTAFARGMPPIPVLFGQTHPDTGKYEFPFVLPKGADLERGKKSSYVVHERTGPTTTQPVNVDMVLLTWAHNAMFMIVPPNPSPKYPPGTHLLMPMQSQSSSLSTLPVSISLQTNSSVWLGGRQRSTLLNLLSAPRSSPSFPTSQLVGRPAAGETSALRSVSDWRTQSLFEETEEGRWCPAVDEKGNSVIVPSFNVAPPTEGDGEGQVKKGLLARFVRGFSIMENSVRGRAQMAEFVEGLGLPNQMWQNDNTWPIGELFYPIESPQSSKSHSSRRRSSSLTSSSSSTFGTIPASSLEGLWTGTYGPHGMEVGHLSLRTETRTRTEEIPVNETNFSVASDWPADDLPLTRTVTTTHPILQYTKVTGDVNVPCGQVSWYAILNENLLTSLPTTTNAEMIRWSYARDGAGEQPRWDDVKVLGRGQLAFAGFNDPRFTNVEVTFIRSRSTFDPRVEEVNEINVRWPDLQKVSKFKRIIL